MLPMLLVDVVKFAVGSWPKRWLCKFFHSAATSFLTSMCGAECMGLIVASVNGALRILSSSLRL